MTNEVSWKQLAQEVEIRSADGQRIRVSRYFSGLGTLAAELRARLAGNGPAQLAADFIERL